MELMLAETENKTYTLSVPDYKEAVAEGKELFLQFNTLTPEAEIALVKVVHRHLEYLDILYLKDYVILILMELIKNAVKANIKRIFFKENSLDINNSGDYRKGMERFKEEAIEKDIQIYTDKLASFNLVTRVAFKNTANFLHISVINNAPILNSELKKVQGRIAKAYRYKELVEAFSDVLDDSEGTGLGLIVAMTVLKNSGLRADVFKLYKKGDLTIAAISIPKNITEKAEKNRIADIVADELEHLPTFPSNIVELQNLCKQPDISIKTIAEAIGRDPALTASMFRMANSAGYVGIQKVGNLEEAVMRIGIKSLSTILLGSGMERIVKSNYQRFGILWQEASKRAFYASSLASKFGKQSISGVAYLASLLSDVGHIILLSLAGDTPKKLREIDSLKRLSSDDVIEEVSIGMSHATLGALICRKWNFSEMLTTVIEFHNRPYLAPENLKDLIYIVYLADIFIEIEKDNSRMRFEFVDEDVLSYFSIADKEAFYGLYEELKAESYKMDIVTDYSEQK